MELTATTKGNQPLSGICFPLDTSAGLFGTSRRRIAVSQCAIETGKPFFREPGTWVVQFFGLAPTGAAGLLALPLLWSGSGPSCRGGASRLAGTASTCPATTA